MIPTALPSNGSQNIGFSGFDFSPRPGQDHLGDAKVDFFGGQWDFFPAKERLRLPAQLGRVRFRRVEGPGIDRRDRQGFPHRNAPGQVRSGGDVAAAPDAGRLRWMGSPPRPIHPGWCPCASGCLQLVSFIVVRRGHLRRWTARRDLLEGVRYFFFCLGSPGARGLLLLPATSGEEVQRIQQDGIILAGDGFVMDASQNDRFQQGDEGDGDDDLPGLSTDVLLRPFLEGDPGEFAGARHVGRPLDEVVLVEGFQSRAYCVVEVASLGENRPIFNGKANPALVFG
mmetsp:Transcript_3885/g.8196  ORF Transcript_3885/g.8196 Transcript_3885/m.8196 type:complete len:284 (+) Transcript_3885:384-1235(+)